MDEYNAMITRLAATGIPFREAGWDEAPAAPWGVYAIDGSAEDLWGDSQMEHQVLTGTVDLFVMGPGRDQMQLVQQALAGVSWRLNSVQYESDTRLTHYEWVFEVV